MSPAGLFVGRLNAGRRVSECLLVQCDVIIPRIHVASNERGVYRQAFDVVWMGCEERSEAAGLVQIQELISKTLEIDEHWMAAAVLPGRYHDARAIFPLFD